jgi:hypothetical protein
MNRITRRRKETKSVTIAPPDLSETDHEVVDLAYNLWLARAFYGGSPAEDLLTAVQKVGWKRSAGLFLVPKSNSLGCELYTATTMKASPKRQRERALEDLRMDLTKLISDLHSALEETAAAIFFLEHPDRPATGATEAAARRPTVGKRCKRRRFSGARRGRNSAWVR